MQEAKADGFYCLVTRNRLTIAPTCGISHSSGGPITAIIPSKYRSAAV